MNDSGSQSLKVSAEEQQASAAPSEKTEQYVREQSNAEESETLEMRVSETRWSETRWVAPLPPPESFNKYKDSIQDRMMTLVESENEYRHTVQNNGQKYAFIVVLMALLAAVVLVLNGYPYGLIALVGILPALGSFLEKMAGLFVSKEKDPS